MLSTTIRRFVAGFRFRLVTTLAAVSLVGACATQKPPVPEAALHPRSVAIIPVLRSSDLTIARRSPVGFLGVVPLLIERTDRFNKQKDFEKRYEPDRTAVGRTLTASMLAAAQKRGYDAAVLDDIARNIDDPEDFEIREIATTADIVIHVRVSDIGLLNPMTSLDYEPFVDAEVEVYAHETGYPMLNETFRYGANGSSKDPYSIPSDPQDRWSNFETVMTQADAVGASWIKGADALGERIISKLPSPSR